MYYYPTRDYTLPLGPHPQEMRTLGELWRTRDKTWAQTSTQSEAISFKSVQNSNLTQDEGVETFNGARSLCLHNNTNTHQYAVSIISLLSPALQIESFFFLFAHQSSLWTVRHLFYLCSIKKSKVVNQSLPHKLYPFLAQISPSLPWTRTATCTKRWETSACTRTSCLPFCPSPRPCLTTQSQIKGAVGDHQHALRLVQRKSCQLRALWFEACFTLIAAVKK